MKQFPKELLVKQDKDGDESWFVASSDPEELVMTGETVTVGVYHLQYTTQLKGVVTHHRP
jgi:hypothetical protein